MRFNIARKANRVVSSVVSKVVGGVLFGKFVGDYALVISKRVFGDNPGPAIQLTADEPFIYMVAVSAGVVMAGEGIRRATNRIIAAAEEAAEEIEDEVEEASE